MYKKLNKKLEFHENKQDTLVLYFLFFFIGKPTIEYFKWIHPFH